MATAGPGGDESPGPSGERRTLAKGDRIESHPCVVTIDHVAIPVAYGHCSTCDERHVIDHIRYKAGGGPWRASLSGRTEGSDA